MSSPVYRDVCDPDFAYLFGELFRQVLDGDDDADVARFSGFMRSEYLGKAEVSRVPHVIAERVVDRAVSLHLNLRGHEALLNALGRLPDDCRVVLPEGDVPDSCVLIFVRWRP